MLRQFFTKEGAEELASKASNPYRFNALHKVSGEIIGLQIVAPEEAAEQSMITLSTETESGEIHG